MLKCFRASFLSLFMLFAGFTAFAQFGYWQQAADYKMDIQLDVNTNIMNGKQTIHYTNHSPDTLRVLYFHLYWNAFQPNSSMDERSRELGQKVIGRGRDGTPRYDWDSRVTDRIQKLQPNETGYSRLMSVKVNGRAATMKNYETIEKIFLSAPILPGKTATIETVFQAQVPVQIRRAGRDNREGIRYSMSQWFPKLANYDRDGWHPNPYIAREFYGIWGDYDVKITLDKNYVVAGTGVLQNAAAIGAGYDTDRSALKPVSGSTRTWNFKASGVHDFVWAADPDYTQITRRIPNGPILRFFYKKTNANVNGWETTADTTAMAFPYMEANFGKYPWPEYAVIQGGDGGMEYAMATLVRSHSLGTVIHELMHAWYQHLLGTNESLYPWMDEGFTSYGESLVMSQVRKSTGFPWTGDYRSYTNLANSRLEEPLSTHADHFSTNAAYGSASYSKGAVFLAQLGYIIGEEALRKTLLDYYNTWKFKHPDASDFVRVAEKASGIELDWYQQYWVNSIKKIDYGIDSLWSMNDSTYIRIRRIDEMPMPVEVQLTFKDSTQELHYVPLDLMFAEKKAESSVPRIEYPAQKWTHRTILLSSARPLTDLKLVEIDPSHRLADVQLQNNRLELSW